MKRSISDKDFDLVVLCLVLLLCLVVCASMFGSETVSGTCKSKLEDLALPEVFSGMELADDCLVFLGVELLVA